MSSSLISQEESSPSGATGPHFRLSLSSDHLATSDFAKQSTLKGLCHEDIAVLGQFFAEVIT